MFLRRDIDARVWKSLLRVLRTAEDAVFLDSSQPTHPDGRFSFIALSPFLTVCGDETGSCVTFGGAEAETNAEPAHAAVARFLELYSRGGFSDAAPGCGFPAGGAFGFASYDWAARRQGVASGTPGAGAESGLWFGFYDAVAVSDAATGACFMISTGLPETDEAARRARAGKRIEHLLGLAAAAREGDKPAVAAGLDLSYEQYIPDGYAAKIDEILGFISAGDTYQVNFSRLFRAAAAPEDARASDVYTALRAANPVPFGGFVRAGGLEALCFSMERFISIRGRDVQTRPIKGTAPRGADAAEDAKIRAGLAASEKNRAELVMIVDLMRNDLGAVCEYGSVRTDDLGRVESFAGVHHTVATVSGRLRPGLCPVEVLSACMPGGSVTGAPKKRTMELIAALEGAHRGLYCGCLGYFGFNALSDFNIMIRTLVRRGGAGPFEFRSGGGITADSSAGDEYAETVHKIKLFCRGRAPELR